MPSTAVVAKAERYLTTGQVTVTARTPRSVRATVVGDTGIWHVTVEGEPSSREAFWRCTCPAWRCRIKCSHVVAVRLVTVALATTTESP